MKIKLSRSQWELVGKKAGWMKLSSNWVAGKIPENIDIVTLKKVFSNT